MVMERRIRVVDTEESLQHEKVSVRVAFATTDLKHVDQHFGSAQCFAIYLVNPDHASLLEASQFGKLVQDGNEDKLTVKLEVLQGCAAVFSQAVGGSAARRLLASGIQPVKVSAGSNINELLDSLKAELISEPTAWLAQALKRQSGGDDSSRFDDMEEEGWNE